MPKVKINRSTVEKLRPEGAKPVYYFDTILPGFAVRVSPKGVKAFVVQGRARGRVHRRAIGRYPAVTPEEARERARAALSAMAAGKAPEERRKATVSNVLEEWFRVHVRPKLKPRTALDYEAIGHKILKPALGALAVADVQRSDLAKLHGSRCGTPRRSNYILKTPAIGPSTAIQPAASRSSPRGSGNGFCRETSLRALLRRYQLQRPLEPFRFTQPLHSGCASSPARGRAKFGA